MNRLSSAAWRIVRNFGKARWTSPVPPDFYSSPPSGAARFSSCASAHRSLAPPFARTLPAPATPTTLDWAAVIALGVICTGFAYLLYFRLIKDVGPMRALSVTFLIPVFGVLWGVIYLDEDMNLKTLLGGALVLLGTALANGVLKARRAEDTRS